MHVHDGESNTLEGGEFPPEFPLGPTSALPDSGLQVNLSVPTSYQYWERPGTEGECVRPASQASTGCVTECVRKCVQLRSWACTSD